MKTIITGVTSFRNHGVEALLTTLLEQLRSRMPHPEFLVLDRVPEYDASRITGLVQCRSRISSTPGSPATQCGVHGRCGTRSKPGWARHFPKSSAALLSP